MAVQDDVREIELREIFGLVESGGGRSGIDALMLVDDVKIEFELKSVTRGGVTTVRDFGRAHIEKWRTRHWLIGKYDPKGNVLRECYYGSPEIMSVWINEKADYIAPDFQLANLAPDHLVIDDLYKVCKKKDRYSIEDAMKLHKKQYKKAEYEGLTDLNGGYSPTRMLEILRARAKYLMERGSTLNNPHIPMKYIKDRCFKLNLESNPERQLKSLVRQILTESGKSQDQ